MLDTIHVLDRFNAINLIHIVNRIIRFSYQTKPIHHQFDNDKLISDVTIYIGGEKLKRPSKIIVRGQSAIDMISEIVNPTMNIQRLELFKKALKISRK